MTALTSGEVTLKADLAAEVSLLTRFRAAGHDATSAMMPWAAAQGDSAYP